MESEKQLFRAELGTIYSPIIYISLITGFIFLSAIFYKDDFQYHPKMFEAVLILESVLIPFLLLIFLFFIFFNRIIINDTGISAISPYSNTPKRNYISWDSIKKVQHRNVMGYEYYLLISRKDDKPVWVPKRIKDKTKFLYAVRSLAGNGNLFTLELMKS